MTTNEITLKIGEAFGLSVENIDKLLKEAGYKYTHDSSSYPWIFYGERVKMDGAYLTPASGVGVFDENTSEILDTLYVAESEVPALLKQWDDGILDRKYGTKVGLVDEAEGYPFYARAEKNGSTTITIPEYPVESGEVYTNAEQLVKRKVSSIWKEI